MKPTRRRFIGTTAAGVAGLGFSSTVRAQPGAPAAQDLLLVNGRIHTMDATSRVVAQVWIRNGRFAAVGNNLSTQNNPRRIDLRGRTVIPGIVDAHNHIVLVGNRPGWHTPLEHVFTIPA